MATDRIVQRHSIQGYPGPEPRRQHGKWALRDPLSHVPRLIGVRQELAIGRSRRIGHAMCNLPSIQIRPAEPRPHGNRSGQSRTTTSGVNCKRKKFGHVQPTLILRNLVDDVKPEGAKRFTLWQSAAEFRSRWLRHHRQPTVMHSTCMAAACRHRTRGRYSAQTRRKLAKSPVFQGYFDGECR